MPKGKKTDAPTGTDSQRAKSFSISPRSGTPAGFKTASSEDVISELKATGKGWTDDIRNLLSIPPQLFARKSDDGIFYSRDLRFGITEILSSLDTGSIRARATDYGIAIYASGSGVYFVLADMGRRIIIRERLFSIHDKPPERDWKVVKERIRDALSMAAGEKEGNAVVSEGIVRKVRVIPP